MATATSNNREGAATAAPSLSSPEDAERLLEAATTPEQAWAIYEIAADREEGWQAVKLKAERRYGELLGPAATAAEAGRKGGQAVTSGNRLDGATKVEQHRARKVAAVPEAVFEDYLKNEPKPTRSGLLRKVGSPPRARKRSKDTTPSESASRLRRRIKQVKDKNADTRPRWTLEDVADVKDLLGAPTGPSEAGKRMHSVRQQLKNGKPKSFWDARWELSKLIYALHSVDFYGIDLNVENVTLLDELLDDLLVLEEVSDSVMAQVRSRLGEAGLMNRLRALRARTVENGCTPEEAETAAKMADRLEASIELRLTA